MSNVTDALTYTAEGAAVGAALGAALGASTGGQGVAEGALGGALTGMVVVGIGGLVVGVFGKNSDSAFETGGVALGLAMLGSVVIGATAAAASKT